MPSTGAIAPIPWPTTSSWTSSSSSSSSSSSDRGPHIVRRRWGSTSTSTSSARTRRTGVQQAFRPLGATATTTATPGDGVTNEGVTSFTPTASSSDAAVVAKPKAVVVGGGWAGFGSAWQLIKHGFEVTLLDASPNPGGLSAGWRTTEGRAVEAGCKGFWTHYKNIDALCAELGVDPFTPYTSSAFYSPAGKEVEAPILRDLPRLPTPLGTLLYTSPYFTNLSVEDRLSALPLALDLLRYNCSDAEYLRYDDMSARDLFLGTRTTTTINSSTTTTTTTTGSTATATGGAGAGAPEVRGQAGGQAGGEFPFPFPFPFFDPSAATGGLLQFPEMMSGSGGGASKGLYDGFLAPIICALMFAPPEELSAAAALDVLYSYVLAHQDDFDVRWCRGTIAEEIFQPWVNRMKTAGGRVLGGRRVALVEPPLATGGDGGDGSRRDGGGDGGSRRGRDDDVGGRGKVVATTTEGTSETHEADVIVLATGVGAANNIIASSPDLANAPGLKGVASIPSTDVIAIRLFLDQPATLPNASNVFAGFNLRRRRRRRRGLDEGSVSPNDADNDVMNTTSSSPSSASTRDIAGTFFDLCALHDEYKPGNRGRGGRGGGGGGGGGGQASTTAAPPTPRPAPGAVIEVDLYNAGAVLDRSDEELVAAALDDVLRGCVPGSIPPSARVVDSSVLRFRGGVTKFAPGTARLLPGTIPVGLEQRGVFMAGDWMYQGPGSHGARGLSQEKALVSGYKAADAAADEARRKGIKLRPRAPSEAGGSRAGAGGGGGGGGGGGAAGGAQVEFGPPAVILQTDDDEPHVAALKEAVRAADSSGALSLLQPPPGGFPPLFF